MRQQALNWRRLGLAAPGYETTSRNAQPATNRPPRPPAQAASAADRQRAAAELELRTRRLELLTLGR